MGDKVKTEKSTVDDLAIMGGPPAFNNPLHVGRPNIGDRAKLLARINDMLDRRWLTNDGPFVKEFERRIADIVGVRHCIATCNGTVALEIAIRAVGLSGEVIVPSFTFVATAHSLQWQEITPVFCDIDPATHTIDPAKVEEMITPRTTGIIGVHLWGRACDVARLEGIANKRRLALMFDAAHAFGCSHQGRMIGNFGLAEVFSFHATKFVNSGEGGAVVTNNDDLASRIRLMKNFGFAEGYDNVVHIGTNGKLSEMSAAFGLTNLESMEQIIAINRRNHEAYAQGLTRIPGVSLVTYDDSEKSNYQYVIIELEQSQTGLTRDRLVEVLHAEKVLARRYFYPGCHRMEPYRSFFPHAMLVLPQTQRLAQRVMALPTGTAVGPAEIQSICDIIRFLVANGREMTRHLDLAEGKKERQL
jgi:dTDP-4-amino-4,6-dideoxygalactose transaminase